MNRAQSNAAEPPSTRSRTRGCAIIIAPVSSASTVANATPVLADALGSNVINRLPTEPE